ncbi:11259_t:CDS:2 [Entrophospora sp. SA101]|nr:11259_t:CDS:2 [Entrophospora sp. SA101]
MEGKDIFKILLEISMVIGPVLGYFDQIAKFRARKSSLGYSLDTTDGVFIEILGYLSLGIESTVPMPQALVNFKYKSVSGFSRWILVTWFIGDSFKTFYYIFTTAPIQFIICGIIQLSVDGVIVLQFVIYGNNRINELIFGQNNNNYGYSRLADDRRTLSYNSLDEII